MGLDRSKTAKERMRKCIGLSLIICCLCLCYILYYHSYTLSHGLTQSYYKVKLIDQKDHLSYIHNSIKDVEMAVEIRRQMNQQVIGNRFQWPQADKNTENFKDVIMPKMSNENKDISKEPVENPRIKWKILTNQSHIETNYTIDWFNATGDFLSQVEQFNMHLSNLRHKRKEERLDLSWRDIDAHVEMIWANRDDFFTALSRYSDFVHTVALPSHADFDVLVQKYFPWTGSATLCRWIRTEGEVNLF